MVMSHRDRYPHMVTRRAMLWMQHFLFSCSQQMSISQHHLYSLLDSMEEGNKQITIFFDFLELISLFSLKNTNLDVGQQFPKALYQKSVRLWKILKKLCTEKLNKSFDLYFMKYWLDHYGFSIESSLFINPELSEKKTV
jgi:hypothetical protein